MRHSILRFVPLLLAAALPIPGTAGSALAQTIDVSLRVQERTGDLFEGTFRSALGELGEVELSEPDELSDYRIDVTVLCLPESGRCEDAGSYALSIVLSEPLTGGLLRSGLDRTGEGRLSDWEPSPEAAAYLHRYRQVHAVWTVLWGRDEARRSAARVVERLDTRCFERRRLLERRAAVEGRDLGDLLLDAPADEGWLC